MDIEVMQTEVVTQILLLVDGTTEAQVITMPDNDNDFKRPKEKKGKIVVGYQQSEMSDTNTLAGVAQVEKFSVIITLQSRTLYGPNGIYTLYKKVKKQVLGFTPTDCETPLKAKYFGPPESHTAVREEECWTYEYILEARAPYIQEADQDDIIAGTTVVGGNPVLPINVTFTTPTAGARFDDAQNRGPVAYISLTET